MRECRKREMMEEKSIKNEGVGKYVAEFQDSAHGQSDYAFLEWEATNEDQGRYDRNIMVHVWLKGHLKLFDRNSALAKVHRVLARQPLLNNGQTIQQSVHLAPHRKRLATTHAVCPMFWKVWGFRKMCSTHNGMPLLGPSRSKVRGFKEFNT